MRIRILLRFLLTGVVTMLVLVNLINFDYWFRSVVSSVLLQHAIDMVDLSVFKAFTTSALSSLLVPVFALLFLWLTPKIFTQQSRISVIVFSVFLCLSGLSVYALLYFYLPETYYLLASFFLAPGPYLAFVPEMICFTAIQVVGAFLFLPRRS